MQTALIWGAFLFYLMSVCGYVLHVFKRSRWLWRMAFAFVIAGFCLQSTCMAIRWFSAGYLPVTNLFSTLFFFSWALALTYIYFELRYRIHASGLFVMLVTLLLLGFALPRDAAVRPLIPALDTPLFTLHIIFSFQGYALFAMAFSLGALYLLQKRLCTPLLPDLRQLRRMNEEAILLGFVLFTLCMLFGCWWAYVAWGYYFSWNIKAVWSFLVWLFYAGMCHAKFIRRWQGTGYAWLSIAGLGVVFFTYLGIGLLLESNHPLD